MCEGGRRAQAPGVGTTGGEGEVSSLRSEVGIILYSIIRIICIIIILQLRATALFLHSLTMRCGLL